MDYLLFNLFSKISHAVNGGYDVIDESINQRVGEEIYAVAHQAIVFLYLLLYGTDTI